MEFGGYNCAGGSKEFTADGHRWFIGSLCEISVCKFMKIELRKLNILLFIFVLKNFYIGLILL